MAYQNWLCVWQRWPRADSLRYSTSKQKHRCSTFAMSFFLRKKNMFFSMISFVAFVCQEKYLKKYRKQKWSQETFSQLKTKCRLSHCRETQEIKRLKKWKNKKKFFRFVFFIFVHLLLMFISFIFFFSYFHLFSILFIYLTSFWFRACSFSWKSIANPEHLHANPLLSFADT